MCEACERESGCDWKSGNRQRLKLWEVKSQYHCAILGTCLTMDDLRKVLRQSGLSLGVGYSDYELHGALVGQADQRTRASHHLQKMLERKYRRWAQATSAMRQAGELEAFWVQQVCEGEIAGPFWALVTHPHTDEELMTRAYGEVHMLSHLQAASNRADRQRLCQLVVEVGVLNERLERLRRHHQGQLELRDRRIQQQSLEISSLKSRPRISPSRQTDVAGKDKDEEMAAELRESRLVRAEERLAQREMDVDGLQHELSALRELLKESREEHAAMEETLGQILASRASEDEAAGRSLDLAGQRVLYVGGDPHSLPICARWWSQTMGALLITTAAWRRAGRFFTAPSPAPTWSSVRSIESAMTPACA